MADGGWIKLYRSLLDDDLWLDCTPVQKVVMITLLLMANHQERKWIWEGKKFTVRPGQFVTSLDSIRSAAGKGISIRAVRTSLHKFQRLGFLTSKSTMTGRLITIVNWAKYQSGLDKTTKQLTEDRQSSDKELTPNKKVRSKEVKDTSISSTDSEIQENFEKLWKLYPNKKGKQLAYRHYRALTKKSKDPLLNRNIQNGIVAYKRYLVESGTEPQYVKQGGTFFNQESWSDDWSLSAPQESNPEPQKMSRKQFVLDYLDSNRGDVEAALKEMDLDGVEIDQTEARRIMEGGLANAN